MGGIDKSINGDSNFGVLGLRFLGFGIKRWVGKSGLGGIGKGGFGLRSLFGGFGGLKKWKKPVKPSKKLNFAQAGVWGFEKSEKPPKS